MTQINLSTGSILARAASFSRKANTSGQPANSLGRQECEKLELDFADTFQRNFVLAKANADVPDTWEQVKLGKWALHHCPKLDCCHITGPGGKTLALVLGVALLPDGTPLPKRHKIGKTDIAAIEREIETLAGRFVALAHSGRAYRLYVDPSCSLVPFFDTTGERIASCLPLAIDRPVDPSPLAAGPDLHPAPGNYFFFATRRIATCIACWRTTTLT